MYWNGCIKIQFVCLCVVMIVEKGARGIRLLFNSCLVQVQCVKKPRCRVRGHQVGFKSGCTSPRCAAWRLKQWRADSSPALAPGRCHNKETTINTQTRTCGCAHTRTHTRTKSHHTWCNPTQNESLSGVADFIDELWKQGGALISQRGTEWGEGWRDALLSSGIAMPTVSSAAPSSSCQKAVIELTFQSGSFNEAMRPASTQEQTCTRYTALYGESALLRLQERHIQ